MSSFNLLLAGVGGQGVVLTSRLIMEDAMLRDSEARGAETHGMAQRGGSVVAHVRIGSCRSPLVIPGTAHVLLAMERMEGLRNLRYLRPGGAFLVNSPDRDFVGDEIGGHLTRRNIAFRHIDASKMARDSGNPMTVNMIMSGLAASLASTPFDIEGLREAAARVLRPRFLEASVAALDSGYEAAATFTSRVAHTIED